MTKKVDLIFTRDFSLCGDDVWHRLLSQEVKNIFGKGLDTQIVRYNGHAMEFYRVTEDLNAVRDAVIQREPTDALFSLETRDRFCELVSQTRDLLKQLEGTEIFVRMQAVPEILKLFREFYPYFMLSVFLVSKWNEDFTKLHPTEARAIIDRWYEARVRTEGTFELIDMFWRRILQEKLTQQGMDPKYSRHIRFVEFQELLHGHPLPEESVLREREEKRYIVFQDHLFVGKDFSIFLQENGYRYDDGTLSEIVKEFSGQVANKGGVVRGTVQRVLNIDEVQQFQEGKILVTPMTDPHYVPAMKKAAAIVTDEGGITCHAAIVSRELNVPCVIGTRVASKLLKDGMQIEVNTDTGIITIL